MSHSATSRASSSPSLYSRLSSSCSLSLTSSSISSASTVRSASSSLTSSPPTQLHMPSSLSKTKALLPKSTVLSSTNSAHTGSQPSFSYTWSSSSPSPSFLSAFSFAAISKRSVNSMSSRPLSFAMSSSRGRLLPIAVSPSPSKLERSSALSAPIRAGRQVSSASSRIGSKTPLNSSQGLVKSWGLISCEERTTSSTK